uniref:VWFA domain-containing protein n=1 Tax=Varanus komodoensis TaxID=61221 RepID=A0A8D2LWT9_VARKO
DSADIVLLVDSSDALGRRSFPSVKSFINKIISQFPIGPNKYRVALVQYSDDVHIEFQLDSFKAKNPMLNHIKKNLAFRGGSLRTGNAIQKVHETFFKSPSKDRSQILVVSTSGLSVDDVRRPAKLLQDEGIKVIALGTKAATHEELQAMATQPFHYYFATPKELLGFSSDLSGVIGTMMQVDSTSDIPTTVPPMADVVFVVDESVSDTNANYIIEFLQNTIKQLHVEEQCTNIGLVTYSTKPEQKTLLSTNTMESDVLKVIQHISPKEGKAHLGAALNFTRKKLFTEAYGSRKTQGVEQFVTIITHRASDDNMNIAAELLQQSGVNVFAIGIEGANITQLTQAVSYPPERNVISKINFSELPKVSETLKKKLVNQIQDMLYVQAKREVELEAGCMDTEKADIYFLIDGSSSISRTNFNDMKIFMQKVVQTFIIGPDYVRFGVVQYSNNYGTEFELDEHTKRSSLEKAINNIKQLGGDTYTGAAINSMQPLFEKARKQRGSSVPCYLIVLTDGEAHDNVLVPAKKLRSEMVNIYAIGVKGANKTQLNEIAGSESRVYFVQSFSALEDIKEKLVQDICHEKVCEGVKADIMFLVDSSHSIGPENFEKMKHFMKELVKKSDIGPDRVQIGVVQFSDIPKEEFPLHQHSTKTDIINAIGRMALMDKNTLTGAALKVISNYFEPTKGARPSVNKILILITDGEAQDEVATPATALREKGIIIYAVGVFNAHKPQLEEISGRPDKVFYVEKFDVLQHIQDDILFCKRIERLDVVFVIDSSGSIGPDNYEIMKNFMISFVNKSDVGPDNVQFGALKYSDDPSILFHLDTHSTKAAVIEAIQRDIPLNGNTYTAKALQHSAALFTEARGSRKWKGVPQVLMVITDGESHDSSALDGISKSLRDSGITIYAIGIKGANPAELQTMAGSEVYVCYVDEFDGLKNISKTLSQQLCNISKPECDIQAEVVFLIDGSKSVPREDFERMKNFLKELIKKIEYKSELQFGMAQFSESYKEEFSLGDYLSKENLMEKINNVSMLFGKKTYIGVALTGVQELYKSRRRRSATSAMEQKLLLITDGKSDDGVAKPAEVLRKQGVGIYAIGVGEVNEMQLQQITGFPDRKYTIDMFSDLPNVTTQLIRDWCKKRPGARCFVDIVLAFDISSQKSGEYLFERQHHLDHSLLDILKYLTDFKHLSCDKETKTQFSVAIAIENSNQPISPKLQVHPEKILNELRKVVVNNPSHLNVEFLDKIWNKVQDKIFEFMVINVGECCCELCICWGTEGPIGFPGPKGLPVRMFMYCLISITNSYFLILLSQGEDGIDGINGINGEEGSQGLPGEKGEKGDSGQMKTKRILDSLSLKSIEFTTTYICLNKYIFIFIYLFYILGFPKCPLYPTELVFALDVSQDTTLQTFEQMREIIIAIVNNTRIRESNCPVGARVAVVSYSSDTHYLIRFSDFQSKKRLIQELNALSYQRSPSGRDLGGSMRFVARNVFKRTMPGANVRRVAVFFSNGQSDNPSSIDTAVLEFSALDIHPAVVAFRNTPHVNRAFAMDTTRLFQVINLQQERDYGPALERLLSCVLCYDKCDPDESCFRHETSPPRAYMDAAFILESSQRISPAEFKQLKDFLGAAIDNFDISAKPDTSLEGDRVAVVSHTPLNFRPQTHMHPAKIEFDFVAFRSKGRMKRHIQESLQPLNGSAAIGHAIQWTISNVFSVARNQRKSKAIFVISAGRTSQWDKGVLSDASLRAKCQGYAFFVLSLGREYDHTELEQLASFPLEQHLLQLGRNHKAELGYAVDFLKPFVRKINRYPPTELKRKCAESLTTKPLYATQIDFPG